MTGWRVGWMIGPADVITAATNLQSHLTSNVANVSQRAAIAALTDDLAAVEEMRHAFDRRRRSIVEMLSVIDGFEVPVAAGRVLRVPVGAGRARPHDPRRHADHVGRAGHPDPRGGRGRGGARRGVRAERVPAAVLRAGRRRPRRGHQPDPGAARVVGTPAPAETLAACETWPPSPRPTSTCTSPGRCASRRSPTLAQTHGLHLPDALLDDDPLHVPADERGWFRFQRLYDAARACVRSEADMRRIVDEAACRRRGRGLRAARDPGGPDVVRAVRRRHDAGAGDRARRRPLGVRWRTASTSGSSSRRPGCGTRSTRGSSRAWPPTTPATAPVRWSGSACPTTSAAARPPSSRTRSPSPATPAWRPCRTAASCSGPRTSRTSWTTCVPTGSGTASGPARTRGCSTGWCRRGSRSSCARRRTCRWGSTGPRPTCRCATLVEAGAVVALGADDPLLFRSRLVDQYQIARDGPRVHRRRARRPGALLDPRQPRVRGARPASWRRRQWLRRDGRRRPSAGPVPA